jgi:hypothetical protein
MQPDETELQMAERHVREGVEHLAHQRGLIAWFRARGYPTDAAETLLGNMEELQRLHREHVAHLTSA